MERLVKDFPQDLRFIYRYFPLIGTPDRPFHANAALSAQAANAASRQGKFWEMHDVLFTKQSEWASMQPTPQFQDWVIAQAVSLGMDKAKFTADLTDPENVKMAQKAWDDGTAAGIPATPFLLVNGQIWPNNVPMDYANIANVIRLTILTNRQYTQCPPPVIDRTRSYQATIKTSKGDIVIELFADRAPLTVNNFVFLAQQGWYNNIIWHRVIPGFVAQTGDPTGSGFGGPGYAFDDEIVPDLKFDKAGVVGMANAGPGSNGSQFFITYAAQPDLSGKYTVFGQVLSGMDVLQNLTPRDPNGGGELPDGDVIQTITITEK